MRDPLTPIERLRTVWYVVDVLAARIGKPLDDRGVDRIVAWLADCALDNAGELLIDHVTPDGVGPPLFEQNKPPKASVDRILQALHTRIDGLIRPDETVA